MEGALDPAAETVAAQVLRALAAAAETQAPCPSNRALAAGAGLAHEARVTRVLKLLRRRRLIAVEWTAPDHGARRVVIHATGRATGWSVSGPCAGDAAVPAARGVAAFARALRRSGGRFGNVTAAEARRIANDTPLDRGLPARPPTSSYLSTGLAGVVRSSPDEDEAGDAVEHGEGGRAQ